MVTLTLPPEVLSSQKSTTPSGRLAFIFPPLVRASKGPYILVRLRLPPEVRSSALRAMLFAQICPPLVLASTVPSIFLREMFPPDVWALKWAFRASTFMFPPDVCKRATICFGRWILREIDIECPVPVIVAIKLFSIVLYLRKRVSPSMALSFVV